MFRKHNIEPGLTVSQAIQVLLTIPMVAVVTEDKQTDRIFIMNEVGDRIEMDSASAIKMAMRKPRNFKSIRFRH